MATFSKLKLDASTDGKAIKVATATSPGTTIHVGSNTATTYDEVWLYAMNTDTSTRKLTIEWGVASGGGATPPDDIIEVTVAPESGLMLAVPGLVLKGNATPLYIKAFAATANVILIYGYVNRITA